MQQWSSIQSCVALLVLSSGKFMSCNFRTICSFLKFAATLVPPSLSIHPAPQSLIIAAICVHRIQNETIANMLNVSHGNTLTHTHGSPNQLRERANEMSANCWIFCFFAFILTSSLRASVCVCYVCVRISFPFDYTKLHCPTS